MPSTFSHQLVSDRILEFDCQDCTEQDRIALYYGLSGHPDKPSGWAVTLTGQKISLIARHALTEVNAIQPLIHFAHSVFSQGPVMSPTEVEQHQFEVVFNDECGPDLERVAKLNGLTVDQWIKRFLAGRYQVAFNGFLPGFSYLSGLPEGLQAPRLENPRAKVLAGSLAIAGSYCAIYPTDSPGGWNIVGWVNRKVFSANQSPPCLMAPGDCVSFRWQHD